MKYLKHNYKILIPLLKLLVVFINSGCKQKTSFSGQSGLRSDATSLSTNPNSNSPQLGVDINFTTTFTDDFIVSSAGATKLLDLIIGLDTSGSMYDELKKVGQNIDTLLSAFAQKSDLDYHIWVAFDQYSVKLNTVQNPSKVTLVKSVIGSNDALERFTDIIQGRTPLLKPLRQDSFKSFLVITDDNSTLSHQVFLETLKRDTRFNGKTAFYGLIWIDGVSKQSATCTKAAFGLEYSEIARKTDAKVYDLCLNLWESLFADLGKNLILKASTGNYRLRAKANLKYPISVSSLGLTLDPASYRYDEISQSIEFLEGKLPPAGSKITVTYRPLIN